MSTKRTIFQLRRDARRETRGMPKGVKAAIMERYNDVLSDRNCFGKPLRPSKRARFTLPGQAYQHSHRFNRERLVEVTL